MSTQAKVLPWSFSAEAIEVWLGDTRYTVNVTKGSAQRYGMRSGWRRVPEKWMRSAAGLNLLLRADDRLNQMRADNEAARATS